MSEYPVSILLVDDDPDVQAVFELIMTHHQLPHAVVGDAESALDYLRSYTPDVVLMDIFLPGLDGFQALSRIRQASLARGSRIIATTAFYTFDTQQEVLNRGFDGYLSKPFDEGLVDYLRNL